MSTDTRTETRERASNPGAVKVRRAIVYSIVIAGAGWAAFLWTVLS